MTSLLELLNVQVNNPKLNTGQFKWLQNKLNDKTLYLQLYSWKDLDFLRKLKIEIRLSGVLMRSIKVPNQWSCFQLL